MSDDRSGRQRLADGPDTDAPAPPPGLDPPERGWWWLPIAVVATLPPVTATFVAAVPSPAPAWLRVAASCYLAVVAGSWLFSPVAVHYDRRYVAASAGWLPSAGYYAVFAPGLGAFVALAYVLVRLDRVGVAP